MRRSSYVDRNGQLRQASGHSDHYVVGDDASRNAWNNRELHVHKFSEEG